MSNNNNNDISVFHDHVRTFTEDHGKFHSGNSAAGTRARKALQNIIKFSKAERKNIQEQKTARKAAAGTEPTAE